MQPNLFIANIHALFMSYLGPIDSLYFSHRLFHYNGVIMSAMASKITSLMTVYSGFIQVQVKENIKAPRHWPVWGELTSDRWFPRTKGQ